MDQFETNLAHMQKELCKKYQLHFTKGSLTGQQYKAILQKSQELDKLVYAAMRRGWSINSKR